MSETKTFDNRYAGDPAPVLGTGTLVASQGALVAGQALGRILKTIAAAVAGTNAGSNGTCTNVALRKGAKVGTYTLTCTAIAVGASPGPASDAVFSVVDPDGLQCKNATAATTPGTAYLGPIGFTLLDGTNAFDLGDTFTIVVSRTYGNLKILDVDNVDGSEIFDCLLADAVANSGSTQPINCIVQGGIRVDWPTFSTGETYATHQEEARKKGVFFHTPIYSI